MTGKSSGSCTTFGTLPNAGDNWFLRAERMEEVILGEGAELSYGAARDVKGTAAWPEGRGG